MKKIFFVLLLLLLNSSLYSQNLISIGLAAGVKYYSAKKNDPMNVVLNSGTISPLANIELEWEFVSTLSLQLVAGRSEFAGEFNFGSIQFGDGGSLSSVNYFGANIKKKLLFLKVPPNAIFKSFHGISISALAGFFYTSFSSIGLDSPEVLNDNYQGSLPNFFFSGDIPNFNNIEILHREYNLTSQIGLDIAFELGSFSLYYKFILDVGFSPFFTDQLDYKYYRQPTEQLTLEYNGTGFRGTFGIRYNFQM